MANEFDIDAYLSGRAASEAGTAPAFDITQFDTRTGLDLAGSEKRLDLDLANQRKQSNVENAWVDKLGLEPEGFTSQAVNAGASLLSGGSRVIGNVATLPIDLVSTLAQASVPNEAIDAYSRLTAGEQAEPGDMDLLNSVAPDNGEGVPQTYLERMQGVAGLRDVSKNIAETFDISKIVNTDRRDRLSDDLKQETREGVASLRDGTNLLENDDYLGAAKEFVKGTGSVIANALKTGVQDPGAVAEYAAENLPQLAAAIYSGGAAVATNAGYGFNELREGYTDYAKEHAGAVPEASDRTKMTLFAASAALAEQVGDLSLIKGFGKAGKGAALKGTAKSMSTEGVTEGYQTFAEGQAHLNDASLEEIIEAATIGAMVGGTYHGVAELAKAGGETANKVQKTADEDAAFTAAVESGDVDALANVESGTYNPIKAVQALGEVVKADPTRAQEAIAQSDTIQQELAQQVSNVELRLETYSPESIQELKDLQVQLEAAGNRQADVAVINEALGQAEQYTPAMRKADETQLAGLQATLAETRSAAERLQVEATPEVGVIESDVQAAQAGDTQATDRLITLTMTNPDSIDTAVVASLAESPNITEAQRTALRTFSEAQVAANALKGRDGVRTDITTGGDGFKGIPQYRNAIRMALANGNKDAARSQVDGIASFAASRQAKADAITTAYEQVKGTDNSIQLVRDADGVWAPVEGMSAKDLKAAGGVTVDARSFRLRDDVQAEADVLAKTAQAYTALVDAAPDVAPKAEAAPAEATQPAPAVQEEQAAVVEPPVETAQAETTVNEDVAPVQVEDVQPETGELSAIRNKPTEEVTADNYRDVNLVGALFTQEGGKDTDASVRPLVAVPDFATAVKQDPTLVYQHLGQKTELSAPQKTAVARFFAFNDWAGDEIRKQLEAVKDPKFRFTDFGQFLVNDDGKVDENLVTATAYSLFTWVNENATQLRNSDESINAILLKDMETEVSSAAYALLSDVGTREAVITAQLGGRIVQALGIRANENATDSEVAKLESSLGTKAMAAMVNLKLASRVRVDGAKLQQLIDPTKKSEVPFHNFIRVKAAEKDGRMVAAPLVAAIREYNTGSQSVLSKLFGVEAAGVEPSYTPVTFDQKYAKRTQQDVPKVLAETLEKEGKKAHVVRQDMYQLWGNLSKAALYEIAGVVSTTDVPTHVENLAGRVAKNDGLMQQVDNFSTFIEKMISDESTNGLEQELFFGRSVWKPQRVGLTANVINPQTSKVHRHMIKMAGWNSTIDMSNADQVNNFKLRILESFDKKTEAAATVDVLATYDNVVNKPEIQSAVDAIAEILRGEANDTVANEQKILAGVKAIGNAFHGLDGLTALAHQRNAEQAGASTFDTELMGEVDGVTNGPMLSLLMLGAKGYDTLNQGGFFQLGQQDSKGGQLTQFNDYKGMGNLDLYEGTIGETLKRLGQDSPKLAALQVITGQLRTLEGDVTSKGRKIIKQPLTAMMFGSNTKTAVEGMADGFIESIYSKMEDVVAAGDKQGLRDVLSAVNLLIGNRRLELNVGLDTDLALNTKLTNEQKAAIKKSFYALLGKPTEDALADTYATFLARRDTINQTAQLAYGLYESAVTAVTEQVLAESPDVPRRKEKGEMVALRTVTRAQQAEILKRLGDMQPILQTALSKASNQPSSGMKMAKTEKRLDSSQPYLSEVAFGAPVETIDVDGKILTGDLAPMSTKTSGSRTGNVDPGVMPFITGIHSTDSFIASTVYGMMEALNVHDALGVDLDNVARVGQELNKATFEAMLSYSVPTSMAEMLDKVLVGVGKLMADPVLAPAIQKNLAALMSAREDKKRGNFTEQLNSIRHVAQQADGDKLATLATMAAIGQYATDGGSYVLTEQDRARATEELSKIGSTFSEDAAAIAEQLDVAAKAAPADLKPSTFKRLSNESVQTLAPATTLNSLERVARTAEGQLAEDVATVTDSMVSGNRTLAEAKSVLPAERAADIVEAVNNVTAQPSVWGQLGTPLVQSDANLVTMLETTEMNAEQLAHALAQYTQDPFIKAVLGMARKALRNIPVVYVTSQTGPEGAIGTNVDKSRGWYAQQGTREALYIKSDEFVESGVTVEMLTHELVHGALAQLVEDHDGAPTPVGRAVAELDNIRMLADEFIANNGAMSAKYRNATSNVHELLAWGLTNADFQREVLGAIQMPSVKGSILTGLQSFIQKITAMLFGGSIKESTAMANLVANATGLFREATATKARRDSLTLRYEDDVRHVNAMTSAEVFDALASVVKNQSNPAHAEYLRGLLRETTEPLFGPYGAFKEQAAQNKLMTPMDVYIQALDTGKLPFASTALASSFVLNQQEAFVLESVQAVVESALSNSSTIFARQALTNLYQEARATLKPQNFHGGDWKTATDTEKKLAQAKYEFIFKPQAQATGKGDYLSRFAALGMASEEVRNVLSFGTRNADTPLKTLPWASRLTELFRRIMTRLASLHTKVSPGQVANASLTTLVEQLVSIEGKRKARLAKQRVGALDKLESALGNVGQTARARIDQFGQLPLFRQSSSPLIRFAGVGISTIAAERVDAVLDHMTKARDASMKSQHGFVMGLVNEARGVTDGNRLAVELFKQAKMNEQNRKNHIEYTVAQVNAAFAEGGANLTPESKAALTRVFLRTNASAISDVVGIDGLRNLLNDPAEMSKFKNDLESQVSQNNPHYRYMLGQVKDLALHKVQGGSTSTKLMLNTLNIANLTGTAKAGQSTDAAVFKPLLDQLLAVYALEYSGTEDKKLAMEVLRTESQRGEHNGVDMILKMHSGLQAKSGELLFKGQEVMMQSGYTPEIVDSNIEVLLVDKADLAKFMKAGYTVGTTLQNDPATGFKDDRVLVTRHGSGMTGLLTGAMSFTGMHRKGSQPSREAMNLMMGTQITSAALKGQIDRAKAATEGDLFNRALSYDPRKAAGQNLIPSFAPDGRIADWRYMMTENNRDALLDRDNSMDQILGTMSGQIVDKVDSAIQNADVVRSLRDQYDADYKNRPSSYLLVGKDSTDPQLAELYRLLPESTKKEIKRVWKQDGMYIPADQMNMIMGYRKYSLTSAFAALPAERNVAEKVLVGLTTHFLGEKAALRVGQAEDVMQELVKEAKDILVVKNIVTLLGNMTSNLTLLAWEGVPLKQAIADHAIGIKAAIDYRKDAKRLLQVEQSLEIGYVPEGQSALETEAVELRDRLARNPLKPLIDAGLMPTIVEDVEMDDGQFTYKSRFQKKVEKYTSKVPAAMREAGKQIYMTHDTASYKFLSQATQLSDLVARYTMYNYTMNRAKDPLSQIDSLRQAEESFVNYDLPAHRNMQFLNDMGIVMFTKYYMRIQKVIMRLVKERPARGLALLAAKNYFSGLDSISDSYWFNRIGNNPLQPGAFGYLGTLDELPAIKML